MPAEASPAEGRRQSANQESRALITASAELKRSNAAFPAASSPSDKPASSTLDPGLGRREEARCQASTVKQPEPASKKHSQTKTPKPLDTPPFRPTGAPRATTVSRDVGSTPPDASITVSYISKGAAAFSFFRATHATPSGQAVPTTADSIHTASTPTAVPATATTEPATSDGASPSRPVGGIVGGVLGGLALVLLVAFAAGILHLRRKKASPAGPDGHLDHAAQPEVWCRSRVSRPLAVIGLPFSRRSDKEAQAAGDQDGSARRGEKEWPPPTTMTTTTTNTMACPPPEWIQEQQRAGNPAWQSGWV